MILPSAKLAKSTMILTLSTLASAIHATSLPLPTSVSTHALPSDSTATSTSVLAISEAVSAPAPQEVEPSTPSNSSDILAQPQTSNSTSNRQIWYNSEARPERTFHLHVPGAMNAPRYAVEGIRIDSRYGTDCHGEGTFIYFTIAYANGTLALDPNGTPGFFHVGTAWYLTYDEKLKKAIFNDAMPHASEKKCKHGHCFSDVLPGILYNNEPIRLKRVRHPEKLRVGLERWPGGKCEYDNQVRKVEELAVHLADIGYFIHGANIPPAILDFVEGKIRPTYPTLEIVLIVWLTVGAIPTAFVTVIFICIMLVLMLEFQSDGWSGVWAALKRGLNALRQDVISAPGKVWEKTKACWNRGLMNRRNGVGSPKNERESRDEEPQTQTEPQLQSYELPEWPPSTRPPSYCSYDDAVQGFYTV